eukprot:TRINITY_DN1925_c0_g1_i1.p1 TRINITY_DN1925_c0_g1~~TRINITY_DN1925_c0_g1_i1.p1  ORF type:complete len:168 (+),score=15.58 TRINITY_DN1925_c0_g1_i1:554-1057(+)
MRLNYLASVQDIKIPFLKSKCYILVVTVFIVLTFFSRGVFTFLTFIFPQNFDWNYIDEQSSAQMQFVAILLIVFWEMLPIGLITFLFWHAPSQTAKSSTPYTINVSNSDTFGSIFNNPSRYDSDEMLFSRKSEYGTHGVSTGRFTSYSTKIDYNTDIIDYSSNSPST